MSNDQAHFIKTWSASCTVGVQWHVQLWSLAISVTRRTRQMGHFLYMGSSEFVNFRAIDNKLCTPINMDRVFTMLCKGFIWGHIARPEDLHVICTSFHSVKTSVYPVSSPCMTSMIVAASVRAKSLRMRHGYYSRMLACTNSPQLRTTRATRRSTG